MRTVVLGILAFALVSTAVGCGADDPPPTGGATEVDDVTATNFAGTYEAASPADDQFFGTVKIEKRGARLFLLLDRETHALSRTPSGAFVFSHEEGVLTNPCDNPNCGDIIRMSGVVFLKTLDDKSQQPQIKLTV